MEPIGYEKYVNDFVGWYAGIPVVKTDGTVNYHGDVFTGYMNYEDNTVIFKTNRKRRKLSFN